MAAPATEHVRNIVLVGQDGAGKTSLAEAMLHVSGKTPRMGTTHDGKSYLDYDEEEIRRHFTLGTSIAPIPYKDYKINLLDTSGQPDFLGDTLATMQAAEMAMFVVDAVDGPQVMTTRLWHEAETMRLCRCVFINHIDREQLDEIVDLIVDTVCSARKVIRIAGDDYPAEVVKSRFMKLDSSHVQYVMDCMKDNTTYVRNIKKYLLAALYNAPTTINSYYSSLVQHDMYGDGQRGRG